MHIAKIIDQETDEVVAQSDPVADIYDAIVWAAGQVADTPGRRYEIEAAP
jgi:hypothetical protein